MRKKRNGKRAKMRSGKKKNGNLHWAKLFFIFFFYASFLSVFAPFLTSMFITYLKTSLLSLP